MISSAGDVFYKHYATLGYLLFITIDVFYKRYPTLYNTWVLVIYNNRCVL